jgi:hypothetical protein
VSFNSINQQHSLFVKRNASPSFSLKFSSHSMVEQLFGLKKSSSRKISELRLDFRNYGQFLAYKDLVLVGKIIQLKYSYIKTLVINLSSSYLIDDLGLNILIFNIKQLKYLTHVTLMLDKNYKLTSQALLKIWPYLKPLNHLSRLQLSLEGLTCAPNKAYTAINNNIGCISMLHRLKKLNTMDLNLKSICYLNDNGIVRLGHGISRICNLKSISINLSWNFKISDTGMTAVIQAFKFLPELRKITLKLEWCP